MEDSGLLSQRHIERIRSFGDRFERNYELLKTLPRCGPNIFQVFMNAVEKINPLLYAEMTGKAGCEDVFLQENVDKIFQECKKEDLTIQCIVLVPRKSKEEGLESKGEP